MRHISAFFDLILPIWFFTFLIMITDFTKSSTFKEGFFNLVPIFWAIIISKDSINNKSLIKHLCGITISPENSKYIPFRNVIRNSTLIFFLPFEIIAIWISPNKRIGDYLVGTKITKIKNHSRWKVELRLNKDFLLSFLLALAISYGQLYFLMLIIYVVQ